MRDNLRVSRRDTECFIYIYIYIYIYYSVIMLDYSDLYFYNYTDWSRHGLMFNNVRHRHVWWASRIDVYAQLISRIDVNWRKKHS